MSTRARLLHVTAAFAFVATSTAVHPTAAQTTEPAGAAAAPAEGAAPADDGTAPPPAKTIRPATGYGPSLHRAAPRKALVKRPGPVASVPTFETLPDGGSRLEVHLTKAVTVEERVSTAAITYVLKGAHLERRNDQNPLVTVHFNTPVASARLVGANRDLNFVIALRASARPTHRVVAGEGGVQVLQVDFPKGDYMKGPLTAPSAVDTVPDGTTEDGEAPAPKKAQQKGGAKPEPTESDSEN